MTTTLTPEQLADARTHDVMAFAYTDTDGKLYTINQSGNRVEAPAGAAPLSAEYQAVAERTAALVISYNKIINLNPADRGIIAELASGRRSVDETLSAGVRDAWAGIKSAADDSGALPNVPGADLVAGAASTVAGAATGFSWLPKFLGDVAGLGGDVANQLGGGTISRENAIAIGTAYASARQVAASGRTPDPKVGDYFKGLFSRHFGSYFGAGLSFVLDKVMGFAQHLPLIGDWIKQQGWAQGKTLAQHLETNSRDADNTAVALEMAELPSIGGQKAADVASLLTTGGIVRDAAGNEVPVAPSDKNNPSPTVPTGPADETAPATPDEALARAQQNKKPLFQRIGDAVTNADFSGSTTTATSAGPVGIVAGTAAFLATAGQAVRGAAEGVARQHVGQPARRAASLNKATDALATEFVNATPRTSPLQFWRKTPEQIEALGAQHAALETRANAATTTAEARATAAGAFRQAAQEPIKSSNILQSLWNTPRQLGRVAGDMAGVTAYHSADVATDTAKGVSATATSATQRVRGMFSRTAPDAAEISHASTNSTSNASKAAAAVHVAEEVVEEVIEEAAKNTSWFARAAGIGSRFARVVPLLGGAVAGGTLLLATSARAETVNGKKLSYSDQLQRDFELRRITGAEYAQYRGLQGAYTGAGLFGVFGMAASEGVHTGIEKLDPVKMERYLPPSIIAEIGSMVGGKPAAPAAPARVAMTAQEVADSIPTVREQARMAFGRSGSGETRFNPQAFARVSTNQMGAVNPSEHATNGGSAQRPHSIRLNV